MTTKQFKTTHVLSLFTGTLMDDFGGMHELVEHVCGHPVWTHELADKEFVGKMQEFLGDTIPTLRHPDMNVLKSNVVPWTERRDFAVKRLGEFLDVGSMDSVRTKHPLQTLAEIATGKPVVAVVAE